MWPLKALCAFKPFRRRGWTFNIVSVTQVEFLVTSCSASCVENETNKMKKTTTTKKNPLRNTGFKLYLLMWARSSNALQHAVPLWAESLHAATQHNNNNNTLLAVWPSAVLCAFLFFAHNSKKSHSLRSHVGAGRSAAGFVWFKVICLDPSLPPFPSQLPPPTAFHPVSPSCSRSSLNAKLDETVPLKCDDPYITPSMVSLSAPVVTSSDGHSAAAAAAAAAAAYSQSNIVRVSAL